MASASKNVRITGRVQGVGFRAWARGEAERRGLAGWVRNEGDGSVAALIAGDPAEVRGMLQAFHAGPLMAAVDEVVSQDAEPPDAPGFAIR